MTSSTHISRIAGVDPDTIKKRARKWKIKAHLPYGKIKDSDAYYDHDDAVFLSYKQARSGQYNEPTFEQKKMIYYLHFADQAMFYGIIAKSAGVSTRKVIAEINSYKNDKCITMESKINRLKY